MVLAKPTYLLKWRPAEACGGETCLLVCQTADGVPAVSLLCLCCYSKPRKQYVSSNINLFCFRPDISS